MDPAQEEHFREAVERKRREARARSRRLSLRPDERGPVQGSEEHQEIARDRPQGIPDPRTKNSGHGKKTADKWNQ